MRLHGFEPPPVRRQRHGLQVAGDVTLSNGATRCVERPIAPFIPPHPLPTPWLKKRARRRKEDRGAFFPIGRTCPRERGCADQNMLHVLTGSPLPGPGAARVGRVAASWHGGGGVLRRPLRVHTQPAQEHRQLQRWPARCLEHLPVDTTAFSHMLFVAGPTCVPPAGFLVESTLHAVLQANDGPAGVPSARFLEPMAPRVHGANPRSVSFFQRKKEVIPVQLPNERQPRAKTHPFLLADKFCPAQVRLVETADFVEVVRVR